MQTPKAAIGICPAYFRHFFVLPISESVGAEEAVGPMRHEQNASDKPMRRQRLSI